MDDRQVIQKLGTPCVAKRLNLAPSSVRVYAMRGITYLSPLGILQSRQRK